MKSPLALAPFLRSLADGRFFRAAFPIALRVGAVVAALAALYGSWQLWRSVDGDLGFNGFLALALTQLALLALGYAAVNVLWLRADDAEGLPGADGAVTPYVAVALRAIGEVVAASQVLGGVAIALLGWLDHGWVARRIFGAIWLSGTTDGFLAILAGLGWGFGALVAFHFAAEQATARWATERNTRRA